MPSHLKRTIERINKAGLSFFKKIRTLLFKPKIVQPEGEPMNPDKEQAVIDEPETSETKPSRPIAENHDLTEVVCEQVMTKLGKPPNFYRCTARHITGTRNYRVNVWNRVWNSEGSWGTTELIIDSFFVTVADDAKIIKPEIERKYTDA